MLRRNLRRALRTNPNTLLLREPSNRIANIKRTGRSVKSAPGQGTPQQLFVLAALPSVLVYADEGAGPRCVLSTQDSLRRHLKPEVQVSSLAVAG